MGQQHFSKPDLWHHQNLMADLQAKTGLQLEVTFLDLQWALFHLGLMPHIGDNEMTLHLLIFLLFGLVPPTKTAVSHAALTAAT